RRVAMAKPSANRIPSIMSATITPEGISTDIPSASNTDQKSCAGIPRYKQVTRPTFESSNGATMLRKKSGRTSTSLSLRTTYGFDDVCSILLSEKTFAFGQVGTPETTMRDFTSG